VVSSNVSGIKFSFSQAPVILRWAMVIHKEPLISSHSVVFEF
jgi:hypothetical protein